MITYAVKVTAHSFIASESRVLQWQANPNILEDVASNLHAFEVDGLLIVLHASTVTLQCKSEISHGNSYDHVRDIVRQQAW